MAGLLPYSIHYENSRGDILRLDEPPCLATGMQLFDCSWKLTRAQRPLGEGGGLLARKRPCAERTLTVKVAAADAQGLSRALKTMSDRLDYDVENSVSGRLWINGSYLRCWCTARVKELSCSFGQTAQVTLTVCPELPAWCTERRYSFPAGGGSDGDGHCYPYAYPMRYGSAHRSHTLWNAHFAPSPMRVTLYGPSSEPKVYVDGNCIGVRTALLAGEYVTIDQQARRIIKATPHRLPS